MKFLILGCGSFAGQALYSDFIKKGYEVYGINRSKPKDSFFWEWRKEINSPLNWQQFNIYSDTEELVKQIKKIAPTHIIDFMGQGMVAPSWEDPSLWYETNIGKKSFVLETIRNLDSLEKYVKSSTPEVFGSVDKLISENDSFNPSTPYAVSQSAIDFHIRCLGKSYDFPYVIGRFANFYGEGQQLYRVIPRAVLSCITKTKFTLDGKGESTRRFIYSSDIITAIEALLFKSDLKKEYNFSDDEDITIKELLKLVCKLTSTDFEEIISYGPDRKGKDMVYKLNCENAQNELDWEAKTNLNEGIKKVVNWIDRNKESLCNHSWEYIHSK